MIRLHGHGLSGNSYKVRLLLELLGLDDEWVRVDLIAGEHKGEAFLALSPFGQVPVLRDGPTTLTDPQAILFFLAARQGDGRIDLTPSPHVGAWIGRIQALPGDGSMKGLER